MIIRNKTASKNQIKIVLKKIEILMNYNLAFYEFYAYFDELANKTKNMSLC